MREVLPDWLVVELGHLCLCARAHVMAAHLWMHQHRAARLGTDPAGHMDWKRPVFLEGSYAERLRTSRICRSQA